MPTYKEMSKHGWPRVVKGHDMRLTNSRVCAHYPAPGTRFMHVIRNTNNNKNDRVYASGRKKSEKKNDLEGKNI